MGDMYGGGDFRRRKFPARRFLFSLIILACLAHSGRAQAPPAVQPSCLTDSTYRILDFWVGSWNVVDSSNAKVGSSRIEKIVGGCAIIENWTELDGSEGKSLFYYATDQKRWKQVWVTPNAMMPGGFKEKRLVAKLPGGGVRFQGEIVGQLSIVLDRTTLTPATGGRVRQVIEISRNGGTSWTTTFDALYVPVAASKPN